MTDLTLSEIDQLTPAETALLERVDTWLAAHRDEYVAQLIDWVSIPSVADPTLGAPGAPFGPEVQRALERAREDAEAQGFTTQTHEGYAVSVLGGAVGAEEEIGLVSHLDVVPAGEGWSVDPYAPFERDDFVVGRGSSDNKGGAVLDLFLLRLFRDLELPLSRRLRVIYGGAEEIGMPDLAHYVEVQKAPVPRVSLVTDGRFPVNFAQKGGLNIQLFLPTGPVLAAWESGVAENAVPASAQILLPGAAVVDVTRALSEAGVPAGDISAEAADGSVLLTAHGQSGHSAFPESTRNAILVLAQALVSARLVDGTDLTAARAVAQILATPYGDGAGTAREDEITGRLTQNGGLVHPHDGGLALHLDIRYPVTVDATELVTALAEAVAPAGGSVLDHEVSNSVHIDLNDPLVRVLQGAFNGTLGVVSEPYSMGGGTHSRVLPHAITFGPGFAPGSDLLPAEAAERAPDFLREGAKGPHGPDEFADLHKLFTALRVYVIALTRLDAALDRG